MASNTANVSFTELGHNSKACTEEKRDVEKVLITCSNCNEEGHRMRDCPADRKVRGGARTCKNCGEEGHISKECEKPRSAENVECKNCMQSMLPPTSVILRDPCLHPEPAFADNVHSGSFLPRLPRQGARSVPQLR